MKVEGELRDFFQAHFDFQETTIKEFHRIRNHRPYPYMINIKMNKKREDWEILLEAGKKPSKSASTTTYRTF